METSNQSVSFARLGYSTIMYPKIECQHCKELRKSIHQPIRNDADYMVCTFCFDEVCNRIEALGLDRHRNLTNFDSRLII